MSDILVFVQANIVLVGIFFVLFVLTVSYEVKNLTKSYRDVGPDEIVRLVNRENATMLDLRESNELNNGTIHGSKHIPVSVLEKRLTEVEPFKDTPLVVFCASGIRAPTACRLLKKNGFSKVYNLKGGVAAWAQANMPLVKK